MLALAAAVVGVVHAAGLRLNLTPSVPRGVYLLRPGVPSRGDLVAACLPIEAAALDDAQSVALLQLYCAGGPQMEESLLFDYRNLLQLLSDCWMAALA